VILVGGDDARWPDALSAGPLAAQKGWPIIPVPGSGLSGTSKAMVDKYLTLSGSSNSYVIIGGPLAVPSSVEEYLINSLIPVANIRRVQGADRYQTNLQVNLYEFGEVGGTWNGQAIALTTGQAPWDAIAAAGWAGTKTGTAVHLTLTESTGLNANAATLIGATASLANGPATIYPLGGQAAIPSALVTAASTVANSVDITSSITAGCVEGSTTLEFTFSDVLDSTEQGIIDNSQILINSVAQSAAQPATDLQFLISSVGTTMTATLSSALANGDVVTYLGITSAQNSSAARAIAGASCTVANDVDGPTLEVIAPKGGSTFFIKSDSKLEVLAAASAANGESTAAGTADATKLSVDDITIGGTTVVTHIEIDALNTGGTLFEVKAYSDNSSTAVSLPAGMTISVDQSKVKDIAGNAGSGTATATVGAVSDTTKPTATAIYVCEQKGFSGAALAATTTTPTFTAKATKDPGTTGNGYKVFIVNQRGLLIPTFAFDATAKTLTVTADVNYHTVADIKTAALNAGFDRFTIGGTVTSNAVATSASGATMSGGNQHCLMAITPSEYLKASSSSVTEVTVGGATVTASAGESAANGSLAAYLDTVDSGTAGIYVSAESISITYITTNTGAPTAKLTIVDYQTNSNTGVSITALG